MKQTGPYRFILLLFLVVQTSVVHSAPETIPELYEQAIRMEKTRQFRSAIRFHMQILEINSGYTPSIYGLARDFYNLGELQQSEKYYELALEQNGKDPVYLTGLGRIRTLQGDTEKAFEILQRAIAIDPSLPDANYALALYYEVTGYPRVAMGYYKKTLSLDGDHVDAMLSMALLLAGEKRFAEASEMASRARLVDSLNPMVYGVMGDMDYRRALDESGEEKALEYMESAGDHYKRAEQLVEDPVFYKEKIVRLELFRNRPDRALALAYDLLEHPMNEQNRSRILKLTGYLELRGDVPATGNDEEALNSLKKGKNLLHRALSITPDDSILRYELEELHRDERLNDSLSVAQKQKLFEYHSDLTRYFQKRGMRERMNYHLRLALSLMESDEELIKIRMEEERRLDDHEGFLKDLRKLAGLNPTDSSLRFRLSRAIRNSRKSIPYRENLLYRDTDRPDFVRTPTPLMIFDFSPESSSPMNPDGGRMIAEALSFHMGYAGRIAPIQSTHRNSLLIYLKKNRPTSLLYRYGMPYDSRYADVIMENLSHYYYNLYIVYGSYRQSRMGLRSTIHVLDAASSREITSFTLFSKEKDALHEMAHRVTERLAGILPYEGSIIKSYPGGIFMNLGTVDDVHKGDRFRSENGVDFVVEEESSYVSRIKPETGNWRNMDTGLRLRPLPPEKDESKKEGENGVN